MMTIQDLQQKELPKLLELYQNRTALFNGLFKVLNFVDTEAFSIFVVLLIWFLLDRKWGIRLAYLYSLSAFLVAIIKQYTGLARPSQLLPGVGLTNPRNNTFPSGAATNATLLFGSLALIARKWWATCIAIFLILLMGFSRIYLGVHFITDVVGGYLLGSLVLGLLFFFPYLEKTVPTWSKGVRLACGVVLPLILILTGREGVKSAFGIIGLSVGLIYPLAPPSGRSWLAFVFALAGAVILYGGFALLRKAGVHLYAVQYLFLGFWISTGVDALMKKVRP